MRNRGAEMGQREEARNPGLFVFGDVPWSSLGSALNWLYVGRLRPLLALGHLELDLLALGERAEAIARDAGEVDEDVLSSFA